MVQELVTIQQKLKAPKGQYNNFGKYKYRSCEDILESVKPILTSAMAREDEILKGMASSQVTGACSSYARKYALNGLFCIDDTKDPDATNKHGKDEKQEDEESLNLALELIRNAKTTADLTQIYNECEGFRGNSKFMNALSMRRKEIERR